MKVYYDRRADEYEDWWLGLGRFDGLERPQLDDDVRALARALRALPPVPTLKVACGTGFLTRHLRGEVVAVYKRYFAGRELAPELGGSEVLDESRWLVVVCA